jgi:ABC-type polysaccharide/polyol phosphate export permease
VNLALLLTVFTIARRDLSYVIAYFINLYMFLTPVFYPINVLPQGLQNFYFLNPMGAIIDAFKNVVFYNYEPRWYSLLFSTTILIVLFFVSYKIFKRAEKTFADIL